LDAPLKLTTDPDTKPVPFTVKVKPVPPAVAFVGEREDATGAGLLIVKVWALEMPPPGGGFVTVTLAVPPVAISAAGMVAMIWVFVTDEGMMAGLLPKFTVAPLAKPEPLMVSVKAALPAAVLAGESDVTVTLGLLMVN